jgi:hypothetical protein
MFSSSHSDTLPLSHSIFLYRTLVIIYTSFNLKSTMFKLLLTISNLHSTPLNINTFFTVSDPNSQQSGLQDCIYTRYLILRFELKRAEPIGLDSPCNTRPPRHSNLQSATLTLIDIFLTTIKHTSHTFLP